MQSKELSIFIDESGDFGEYEAHSPFYIVSMVFHDQSLDISREILNFDNHLKSVGFFNHAIHTAPLIRNDISDYRFLTREERRKLFNSLFHFARKLPIKFISGIVKKYVGIDEVELTKNLTKEIKSLLIPNQQYINSFDKIIIYYDNGQIQLTKIITTLFTVLFDNVEMRKVKPIDYKLFQVADLICTLELANAKIHSIGLSKSENDFYMGPRCFEKNIYKYIKEKKLNK